MITSNQNQQYKYLMKLKKSKYRHIYQEAIIFGEDLIDATKKAGNIQSMIVTKDQGVLICLSSELFETLADYHMENQVGALVSIKDVTQEATHALVCENIQDPRNLGALFRSALAFGFKHIYVSHDSVDPYHELALRSAKGTTFQLSIHRGTLEHHVKHLKSLGYVCIGTSPQPQATIEFNADFIALILGNEGRGLTQKTIEACDSLMHIKTESVESLNVSVAGAICMYDIRRLS